MPKKEWKDIKIGDTITNDAGEKSVVLEVGASGETFMRSAWDDFAVYGCWFTLKFVERRSVWTLEGEVEAWEPKRSETYYFLTAAGINWSTWCDDAADYRCRNGLGVFPTEDLAQAAFEKCKKAIKSHDV